MQKIDIDQTDRRILGLLQTNPGIKATEIGERIGLSQSACWRRIQRLRDEGVIKGPVGGGKGAARHGGGNRHTGRLPGTQQTGALRKNYQSVCM